MTMPHCTEVAALARRHREAGTQPLEDEMRWMEYCIREDEEGERAESTLVSDYVALMPRHARAEAVARLLRMNRPRVHQMALEEAAELADEMVPYLRDMLRSPDQRVRWLALDAAAHAGEEHREQMIPLLIEGLQDDDFANRWVAVRGLTALGEAGFDAVVQAVMEREATIPFHRAARQVLLRTRHVHSTPQVDALIESLGAGTTTLAQSMPLAHEVWRERLRPAA